MLLRERKTYGKKKISKCGELEIHFTRQGWGSNLTDRGTSHGIVISSLENVVFLHQENCTREYIHYFRYSSQNCRWYCIWCVTADIAEVHTYTQWSVLYLRIVKIIFCINGLLYFFNISYTSHCHSDEIITRNKKKVICTKAACASLALIKFY